MCSKIGEFERYRAISRQRTNTGHKYVSACSQEPVDSTDAIIVETSTCLKTILNEKFYRPIIDRIGLAHACSAAPLNVQSSYRYENIMQIGEVLGHHIDAKISPKAASEKAQTTVSENRYTSPNIDVFRTAILTLTAPTGDNARASFLVHQVPRTSATLFFFWAQFSRELARLYEYSYWAQFLL